MSDLTQRVHQLLRETLQPADFAIDATAGNGWDTAVLARCVPQGSVLAIDIQQTAIDATSQRLGEQNLSNVMFAKASHAMLQDLVPPNWRGQVGAIAFNLGYLPGGDKQIVTKSNSTCAAISAGMELLRLGGIITVIVYRGHEAGAAEGTAVEQLLQELDTARFVVERIDSTISTAASPVLYILRRMF